MNKADKVAYFANVFLIASADNKLEPTEHTVLSAVLAEIGADARVLEEAKQLITSGSYSVTLPRERQDQLKNIEDMVLVALADGSLDRRETAPIEKLTEAVRLVQADMDMIVARARARLWRMQREGRLAPQGAPPDGEKYARGRPQRQAPSPPPSLPAPPPLPAPSKPPPMPKARESRATPPPKPKPIQSTAEQRAAAAPPPATAPLESQTAPPPKAELMPSQAEQRAAEAAKQRAAARRERWTAKPERAAAPQSAPAPKDTTPPSHAEPAPSVAPPIFRPPSEGLTIQFQCERPRTPEQALAALQRADDSGAYRKAGNTWQYAVWHDAQAPAIAELAITVSDLPGRQVHLDGHERPWQQVFPFADCALARRRSEHPAEYCFGAGTGELNPWGCRLLGMPWAESADWFSLGAFVKETVFEFDHDAIREKLEARLAHLHMCPHLREAHIATTLRLLPPRVTAWGRWRFREAGPDSKSAVPRNIKRYVHGCGFSTQIMTDGVVPVRTDDAMKLIREAARTSGIETLDERILAGRQ
ncbi:MAG: TerB family tellurite resistance protein [Kiritimatiellae bacterium]|nr:TerB family tellurite resistance protein [Kiritimatiellia bacterium]